MVEPAVLAMLPGVAQRTLETMFFAEPDEVSENAERPAGKLLAASLRFWGPIPGRFGLLASEPVARTLAANFIGCEEADLLRADQVSGVMAELANMICGAALSELEPNAAFDLSTPEALAVEGDEPGPDFDAWSAAISRFEFPEGTLVLFLALGTPPL